MPYSIKFENPPAGYAAKSARRGEKDTLVVYREFLTTEDGMLLVKRLEGFASQVINMIYGESHIGCSRVDHMLAHFDKEGYGVAYVNELNPVAMARVKRSCEKGESLYRDDIVEYQELRFEDVEVPEDHAVMVVLSCGWRKAFYYDFGVIHPEVEKRNYDLWLLLGSLYSYLTFQEIHSLSEESWELLFENSWFPFVGLGGKTIDSLLGWLSEGSSGDEILPAVSLELLEKLPQIQAMWEKSDLFIEHIHLLQTAVERFKAEDWVSCSSILYPRIEGVLRSLVKMTSSPNYDQSALSSAPSLASSKRPDQYSRILPHKFNEYLRKVYFKSFDTDIPTHISRNTVGHGVAMAASFNQKAAVIGFLIIEQIFYHLPVKPRDG